MSVIDDLNILRDLKPRMSAVHACFCMGPQNGQPVCPCRMKDVIVRDGRYIKIEREVDLGPARA